MIIGIGLALVIRVFFVAAYKIPSGSMQPTLKPGDFIFVNKKSYDFLWPRLLSFLPSEKIKRGDVIVFSFPNQPHVQYIKRVIGLGLDKVEIKKGQVFLNDQKLEYQLQESSVQDNPNPESFAIWREFGQGVDHTIILEKTKSELFNFGPITVPEHQVFVIGDNRDTSDDSRNWGPVPESQIKGRASVVWMSVDPQKNVRWTRVFYWIH